MANIFNSIKLKRPRRNAFDLSFESKLTLDAGRLIPFMCKPVVPGDKFRVNTEILVRMAPLIAPVMHRINVFTHFFFVPNRLLWSDWENFITSGVDGENRPVFPTLSLPINSAGVTDVLAGYLKDGSLWDYLGLPSIGKIGTVSFANPSVNSVSAPFGYKVSALPFRAYNLIFNEYYRDQNITGAVPFSDASGDTPLTSANTIRGLLGIRTRCWEKDYFTSALPWVQRGPDVSVPVQGTDGDIPVKFKDNLSPLYNMDNYVTLGDQPTPEGLLALKGGTLHALGKAADGDGPAVEETIPLLKPDNFAVNVSQLGININDLRTSNALQRWFERNARSGSRYIEQILSHFGVRSSDARLQRPQFLGGGRTPIAISEVLQTSSTDAASPQANMAGHGISAGVNHGFTRYFEEHGYIMGIMSIIPRSGYQQGVPRDYRKFDNMDFYFPEFAHLGEQEIHSEEVYLSDSDNLNEAVFGYTPRYSEYKYSMNESHGDFRGNLSFWHMNRIFNSRPSLNSGFVSCDPINRVFATADTADDKYWVQMYNDIRALRLMPKYGTPML